jgi:hypothetical protein
MLLVLHLHAIDSPTISVAGATATELTDFSKLPHRGTASWGTMRMRSGMSHSSVASDGAQTINQKETASEPECKEAVSPSI